MTKLKYGEITLDVYDGYEITKSSQEVSFSDLTCDFTNRTIEELPEKYQESKLVEIDGFGNEKVLFFGYIESYDLGEMRETDVETNLNITLLSPMKLTTLRTATAVGTYQLKDLLQNIILAPLLEDGFTLAELELTDRQITVNYLVETIEYCMNNLSNKFNFWWFIDEKKVIYIKDIEQMLKDPPSYHYDETHSIKGLQYIKPSLSSEDYANVVNFKNVRIYEYSRLTFQGSTITESHNPIIDKQITTIKKDEQIDFNFPIDIKKENVIKSGNSNLGEPVQEQVMYGDFYYYAIKLEGTYSDNATFTAYIRYNDTQNTFEFSSNIGFEEEGKDFSLIRDNFFKNLVIGIKYRREDKNIKSIQSIKSDSALLWNINKLYNDSEIVKKKGKVSNTGIVELTVDMNESWKTIQELRDIGVSYMNKNSLKLDGTIEMLTNHKLFEIGKTIQTSKLPLIQGCYIITEIREIYSNQEEEYYITAKNSNMLNNYIDVFRKEAKQESEDKNYKLYITHYEEDFMYERFEVI